MDESHGLPPLLHAVGLVGEEAAEVVKEVFKISRFGLYDINPKTLQTNLSSLQGEITDLVAVIRVLNLELIAQGHPPISLGDEAAIEEKIQKIRLYGLRSLINRTLESPLQVMPPQTYSYPFPHP